MVGMAVIMMIYKMHDKSWKFLKSSQIQSFTYPSITMTKLQIIIDMDFLSYLKHTGQ